MKATDGCMVISIEEARIILDAMNSRPLNTEALERLHSVKQRMWDNVVRHEKKSILSDLEANMGEWWEVKCL